MDKHIYKQYISSLLSGDRNTCRQIVEAQLETNPDIKSLYTNLFQRSLYEVGELWEYNKISVAVEHLATSITESLMSLVYPILFSAEKSGKKAIIACIANEYHQIGARMVADVFELNQWDGYFLGANTPVTDLFQLIDEKKPKIIGISVSIYFNMKTLLTLVDKIQATYPGQEVLVGGQAFRWGGTDIAQKYPDVSYFDSLDNLEAYIKTR
jgi:methanogenic corrinoid protein MtbC1